MSDHQKENEPEKNPSVGAEIQILMDTIITAAEHADADATFAYLTTDPEAVFFQDTLHYNRDALLSRFREKYKTLHSQKFEVTHSETIVLSPQSAVWIGYGKGRTETKGGESIATTFAETWVWQKIRGRWEATHYHG